MGLENNTLRNKIIAGLTQSLWLATTEQKALAKQIADLETEVLIIGGGITGITAALMLLEAGKKVILIEQNRIAEGASGHTTAKVTSQHGFLYQKLAISYGLEAAKIYGQANEAALSKVVELVDKHKINCDFQRASSYAYTEDPNNVERIEIEASVTREIGLEASYATKSPLPFDIKAAVRFEGQAQFHPRKYLLALADIVNKGGLIFEDTRALKIKKGKKQTVVTNRGKIVADQIILASHFPFFDKGFFYARLYPRQAYAIALKVKGKIPDGLYYSEDGNHHSIRNQPAENGKLLIVGGGYHHSGQGGNTLNYYQDAAGYAIKRFEATSIENYWSAQDYRSIDNLPFIGRSPFTRNIYVATGFGSWGMTNGTLAAMLITDSILKRKNPWAGLFSPSRYHFGSTGKMLRENASVMAHYFKGLFSGFATRLRSIEQGNGKVVRGGLRRTAAYRKGAKIDGLSAVCKHMYCTVNWNNAEKSWDCPCHGSRYDLEGKTIHGPAVWDLEKRNIL